MLLCFFFKQPGHPLPGCSKQYVRLYGPTSCRRAGMSGQPGTPTRFHP
ncbi:hypothetical protein BACCAP_02269 [Pseudoflavonifractor capillosus ATCC 29799]|uniref:Uncharacterized protein n=1 Tax=Pseudoflavonifractor capillosus ATCC 29799 TaxID=411467 RepID=A6NVM6_9FIRM|nr:hypothetical protein BACCAP_02269 [Pseudoflavonifractor capillosus ATCC 29799]